MATLDSSYSQIFTKHIGKSPPLQKFPEDTLLAGQPYIKWISRNAIYKDDIRFTGVVTTILPTWLLNHKHYKPHINKLYNHLKTL